MKLVDDRGRLGGRINLVDFLLLCTVLLVVLGVGGKLLVPVLRGAASSTVTATMVCRVRAVMPQVYEVIKDNYEGQLVAGTDLVKDAYVVDLKAEPARQFVATDDGRVVEHVDSVRFDLVFTIEAKIAGGGPILKIGTQEVRVGIGHFVKTTMYEFGSVIEDLQIS